jgi:high-affinity iron transporter
VGVEWADAVPNLLIGLREGLEAGLVVSILLAAVSKIGMTATTGNGDGAGVGRRAAVSAAPVWLGVLGAVMVAGNFAAVLTYSTDALSSRAQQAVGGVLSVLAVGLVTGMIFWMRRVARTLSEQLRGDVAKALRLGAGALTLTAFLAVSREGLETTLFIWTAVKASASTAAPLVGAAIGLVAAVVLCWLLYQRAVRLDLGKFFNRTAIALVVVAAGVLAYGLRDLQEAGWLPGQRWVAFDATAQVDPNTWWMSILTGVTQLSSKMTVLQVVAWLVYLIVAITLFVAAGREPATESITESTTAPSKDARTTRAAMANGPAAGGSGHWERLVARRAWPVASALVVVPACVAGLVIAVLPASAATATTAVSVTDRECGAGWTSGQTGSQTFAVTNKSSRAGEITLLDSSGAIVAEIETLGPATTAPMSATLGPGQYSFACLTGGVSMHGKPVQVSGQPQSGAASVKRVTPADLTGPNDAYQAYAGAILATLARDVDTLRSAVAHGDRAAAKQAWLVAQLDWERVGASYNSFGDAGQAVAGLPDGLPDGANDSGFTGLRRVEYGLYRGQPATELLPVIDQLAEDVATLRKNLSSDDEAGDPTKLTLRAHEILEDALRDHVSGIDDQGSGMAYALSYADSQVTRTVVGEVSGLLNTRAPALVPTINAQLDTLQQALLSTRVDGRWIPMNDVPLAGRQRVNAALGAVLETLSIEPTLLEVPPTQ